MAAHLWIWRDIETSKRPDTAPLSVSFMQLLLLELTVPTWRRQMKKRNPHIRSWWGSAGGETGRHDASLLKRGAEDSQVGHCGRSTCYSTSQGLRKRERKSLLLFWIRRNVPCVSAAGTRASASSTQTGLSVFDVESHH